MTQDDRPGCRADPGASCANRRRAARPDGGTTAVIANRMWAMATLPDLLVAPPLELRRWREADLAAVMAAIRVSIEDLSTWLAWFAGGVPSETSEREVLRAGVIDFDQDVEWAYSLFEVAGDEVVGGCALHPRGDTSRLEIGYWVRSDRHRLGYATEAARCLTDAAFRFVDEAERVEIRMDQANEASVRVAAKLAYGLDGDEPRQRLARGHSGQGFIWSMTRDRWQPHSSSATALEAHRPRDDSE